MKPHKLCSCLNLRIPDRRIKQRNLVAHRPRDHVERLLHITKLRPLLPVRDPVCLLALDQRLTGIRPVKSQKQLKDRTLSGAGAPRQRHLLAWVNCET